MMRIGIVLIGAIVFSTGSASGEIYEWVDGGGSRHFTNDVEDIPEASREAARVFVREKRVALVQSELSGDDQGSDPLSEGVGRRTSVVSDEARSEARARREARRADRRDARRSAEPIRQAQVVYDRSFDFPVTPPAVSAPPVVQDVNVNISGPLAVSEVVVLPPDVYSPYGRDYRTGGYGPRVATSFDRGRSRHQTVRMLLQDQFQYDRNGPSYFVGGRIPLGPTFSAKLPRGVRSCSATRVNRTKRRTKAVRR